MMNISLFKQEESHLQFLSGSALVVVEEWGKIHLRGKTFFCTSTRKEISNFLTEGLGSLPSSREQWKVLRLKGRAGHGLTLWGEGGSSSQNLRCWKREVVVVECRRR